MAKISNSEINALIRKLEAEVAPTKEELKKFEETWKPTEEEEEHINLFIKYKEVELQYREHLSRLHAYNSTKNISLYTSYTIEEVLQKLKSNRRKLLTKKIDIQSVKDDLLLSGLSSDFNLEEWVKEAKTKYIK